jgi:hypothetical protein
MAQFLVRQPIFAPSMPEFNAYQRPRIPSQTPTETRKYQPHLRLPESHAAKLTLAHGSWARHSAKDRPDEFDWQSMLSQANERL